MTTSIQSCTSCFIACLHVAAAPCNTTRIRQFDASSPEAPDETGHLYQQKWKTVVPECQLILSRKITLSKRQVFFQEVHLLGLGLQSIALGVIAGLLRLGGAFTSPMAREATCIATSSLLQLRDGDLIGSRTQNAIPASSKASRQVTVLLEYDLPLER